MDAVARSSPLRGLRLVRRVGQRGDGRGGRGVVVRTMLNVVNAGIEGDVVARSRQVHERGGARGSAASRASSTRSNPAALVSSDKVFGVAFG
jgi:hypothetical protein